MRPRSRSDPGFGYGPAKYPGTFLLAFRQALAELGWQPQRWLGHAVECADGEGHTRVVGLENLYRRLRGTDRVQWPGMVATFLQTALDAEDTPPPPLADAAGQLLVRLGLPQRPEPDDPHAWSQPIEGTGLVLNLVIDYPDRMIYATEPMVAESGRSGAEWLQQAIDNLRQRSTPDAFEVIHEESGLVMCNVADAYDSSRALLLDDLLPEGRADGYFVAVPGRDQLLVLPVSRNALGFLQLLKVLSGRNFKSAPYPLSSEVFWIRAGRWHRFHVDFDGERLVLGPPEEFTEILERLEAEPEEGEEPEAEQDSPP